MFCTNLGVKDGLALGINLVEFETQLLSQTSHSSLSGAYVSATQVSVLELGILPTGTGLTISHSL